MGNRGQWDSVNDFAILVYMNRLSKIFQNVKKFSRHLSIVRIGHWFIIFLIWYESLLLKLIKIHGKGLSYRSKCGVGAHDRQ